MIADDRVLQMTVDGSTLEADVSVGADAVGIVLFVHGSGSSRHSTRNQHVAQSLRQRRLGTVLMDLLTTREERLDAVTGHLRFDIPFLSRRVVGVIDQLRNESNLRLGLFGASTGAAAALVAASQRPRDVAAIVSRGGRPDLAGKALSMVTAPTLLIVGGADEEVLALNRQALRQMPPQTETTLEIVPGATHLFQERGALERVAESASDWFVTHLQAANGRA